ncbi:MAG: WG repeat-containing protein [Pedobacter sp.]|nr:MAG: WG repeat-containing protein [Pedobacter sp.]
MKKNTCLTFLLLLTVSFAMAQTSKNDIKSLLKGKSLAEAKAIIIKQNNGLERLIKLASTSIRITPGNTNNAETRTTEKFDSSPKNQIIQKFNQTLNKLYFNQKVIYPNTTLDISYREKSLMYSVTDYDDYKFPAPELKLKKVYYQDGTTSSFDKQVYGRSDEKADEIKGTKWIDSIELEASYHYPEAMPVLNLSPENPLQQIASGKIQLISIEDATAILKISPEAKEKILKVEGINSVGKALDQSGSSSSSNTMNYSVEFLTQCLAAGKNAIEKIDKNSYKNIDELADDLYENMPKEDKNKPVNMVNATFSFRGNLKQINIFLKPEKSGVNNYRFILKNTVKYVDGLGVAYNKNDLAGILDKNGKWVAQPSQKELSHYKGNYFFGEVMEDGYRAILWLDKTNQKLVPFKYRFYRNDAMLGKYYGIEDGINGPKGLIEIATNKVVIEPTLDNISEKGNFIVLTSKDEINTIVNRDLKKVLEVKGYNYKANGNFIFYSKPYTSKEKFADYSVLSSTDEIYNAEGKKINKEDYKIDTYDFFGMDSLLLLQNKLGNNLFINTKGNVVIDGSKYKDVGAFSNGLAPVKSTEGKWGYINPKGEVVIPFMYNEAKNFSKISAMVKTEEGYQLIDHKNRIIKKFDDGFSSYSIKKDAENLEYRNYNRTTYNSKGEVVKD